MARLSELVNQVRRRTSEGQNFTRNPAQMIWQWGRKRVMLLYGKASLPGGQDSGDKQAEQQQNQSALEQPAAGETIARFDEPHSGAQSRETHYSDVHHSGTVFDLSNPRIQTDALLTAPILQPGERLQGGWWGVYTIKACVYAKDWIRRYDGLQDNGSEPVWIYEYCFDQENWSEDDIDERKRRFKHLVDLNLRLGEGSDFRIVRPKDVIKPVGNRVYLITRPVPHSLTLDTFLTQQSVHWNRPQIERFLNQVLQSLQYLQTYLVNWPGDRWEQKLSHGNLSGECLWIRLPEGSTELNESPFFVYLGRFPLWEHLFWPQPVAQHNGEIGTLADDLRALAQITFALICGYQSDEDPADLALWPNDDSIRALYPYVLQLLGHGSQFKSIDSAISVLQTIPDTYQPAPEPEEPTVAEEPVEESGLPLSLLLLGGFALLGLIVGLATVFRPARQQRLAECTERCRLTEIESDGLDEPIRYGIEAGSSWGKAFFSRLTSPLKVPQPTAQLDMTELQRTLQERDPELKLEKFRNVAIPKNLLLEYLRTDVLDVALVEDSANLSGDLEKRVVGYDGIAIFVTHSNAKRRDSIPKRLRGQVSMQQLQEILLDPNASLRAAKGARVQIYWPEDEATAGMLRDFLFEHDADRQAFDQRRREDMRLTQAPDLLQDSQQDNLYERMVKDFEDNAKSDDQDVIGIGFDRISRVIGQCSVYPLALLDKNGTQHHLFVDADGNPIDQTTDLCGDKGTYWVNHRLFQGDQPTYPLAYEMAVVYHRSDGVEPCDRYGENCDKGLLLADKLLTIEGQYLLSEVGVIPVKPIKTIRQMVWSSVAQGGTP
ncbi:hypothetical protein IQ260_19205 [Leptolyngbya cf. ectocarpi LEGE 11479]|uniref:Protein kinase domain-containing protein n=1 Tax=Leptolyngbya cf. ectocarpi LEGE 11479 TaxID=1828722 RepID=A0A928ZWK6_LEPEC|nr:hypothetical protein [Leptolyngbya ectocarpi]MBE9068776.1 hypothetical protein [Leptolyngbya cf. ectocarpi LEGE 11479]